MEMVSGLEQLLLVSPGMQLHICAMIFLLKIEMLEKGCPNVINQNQSQCQSVQHKSLIRTTTYLEGSKPE